MHTIIGLRLKYDVYNRFGLCIVPAGTVLDELHLDLFRDHHIDAKSIITEHRQMEQGQSSEQSAAERIMDNAVKHMGELLTNMRLHQKLPLLEIRTEIVPMVNDAASNPDIFRLMNIMKGMDEYTHQHNIGVGVLSVLLGKWLDLSEFELQSLSLAAVLHDIGKIRIPLEILNKPESLTPEEWAIMRMHPVYGYQILKETTGISHRIALVALQHHEREDGCGYPFGLTKEKIHRFSKIVAVADVFHATMSRRPYHEPRPFHEIVNLMRDGMFGLFDPVIVSVFLKNITNAMVGNRVILSDGRSGKIIYVNPQDTLGPLIEVDNLIVDLGQERQLRIVEVIA